MIHDKNFTLGNYFMGKVTNLTTEVLYSKVVTRKLISCANITVKAEGATTFNQMTLSKTALRLKCQFNFGFALD
jgi:hypothetical protein